MRDLSGAGRFRSARTAPDVRCDMTDQRDAEERAESSENADPIENADMKEPTDPTDRAEPTDPMDSTDPLDPIDRIDPSDHRDHFDVCGSVSVMSPLSLRRPPFPTTPVRALVSFLRGKSKALIVIGATPMLNRSKR
jgi:hypothetical protein